jgi:hypothetical protein
MPGLGHQLGQAQHAQRRFLRGLEHHRVAGGQRRGQLPRRHQQREIPRHDRADHAQWFAGDQAQLVLAGGRDLAVDLVQRLGRPREAADRRGQVDVARIVDRLAHVQGFQQGQLVGVLLDQRHQLLQGLLALDRPGPGPVAGLEAAPRRAHRAVDVRLPAARHLPQHPAVDRAGAVEGAAVGGIDVLAIDEGLGAQRQACGHRFPVRAGACSAHFGLPRLFLRPRGPGTVILERPVAA